jgi:hypothetical protein
VGGILAMSSKIDVLGIVAKIFLGLALVAFAVIIGPLLGIWALNTLFAQYLNIPYTLETWAASALLFTTSSIFKINWKKRD